MTAEDCVSVMSAVSVAFALGVGAREEEEQPVTLPVCTAVARGEADVEDEAARVRDAKPVALPETLASRVASEDGVGDAVLLPGLGDTAGLCDADTALLGEPDGSREADGDWLATSVDEKSEEAVKDAEPEAHDDTIWDV